MQIQGVTGVQQEQRINMDINIAALELKRIEIIEDQIRHLRSEAEYDDLEYSESCNSKAQELIKMLPVFSNKEDLP
jgi:hypothetical protein